MGRERPPYSLWPPPAPVGQQRRVFEIESTAGDGPEDDPTVVDESAAAGEATETTTPGFGRLVAVLALLAAGALATRVSRRR